MSTTQMGIPKFYGRWITSDKYIGVIMRALPTTIANFMIDGNGSIHNVAQDHYGYGNGFNARIAAAMEVADPLQQEYEFDKKFGKYLLDLISRIKPQVGFILAVDGVAPIGKISQQQERRNKAVHGLNGAPKRGFDSNCITPGTPFMVRLDRSIQQWIYTNKDVLPPQLIYSSHMVRGEGEHNIFDHLRKGEIRTDMDGYNVVYGLDADLIILSLLSPAPRIILCREDLGRNVNIDILREAIVADLKEGVDADDATLIRDFAFLTFFVGNDFLRPIFALGDVGENINDLMETYKAIGTTFTDEEGYINWETVWALLSSFAAIEEDLLSRLAGENVKFPFPPLMDAVTITYEDEGGQTYTGDVHVHEQDEGLDLNGNHTERPGKKVTLDYGKFRSNWYRHILGPRDPAVWDLLDAEGINPVSEDAINTMCIEYLKTLQWNLLYYMKGEEGIKKDWVYHYRYAPLLKDLERVCRSLIDLHVVVGEPTIGVDEHGNPIMIDSPPTSNLADLLLEELSAHDDDIIFSFNEQLIAVIPPSSFQLIPERLRMLVQPGGPLCDMCPINFVIDTPHKNEDWETVAVLPFIPVKRVFDTVQSVIKDETLTTGEGQPLIIEMFSKDVKIPIKVGLTKNPHYNKNYTPRDTTEGFGGRGGFNDRGRGRGGFNDRGRGRGGFNDRGRGRGGGIPRPGTGYRAAYNPTPKLTITPNRPPRDNTTGDPKPVNLRIAAPPVAVAATVEPAVTVAQPTTVNPHRQIVKPRVIRDTNTTGINVRQPYKPQTTTTPFVPKTQTGTTYVPKTATMKPVATQQPGVPYVPKPKVAPAYAANRRPPTIIKMDLNGSDLM